MSLPNITLPIYKCLLPSENKEIDFRPFTVKEQKILMIANETSDTKNPNSIYTAIKQVINNCTFNKLDIEKLSVLDIEYLFLNLRAKSIGEIVDLKVKCPNELGMEPNKHKCGAENKIKFDLMSINVEINPDHNKKIMLSDKMGVMMKYPDFTVQSIVIDTKEKSAIDQQIELSAHCIDYIFDETETYSGKDTDIKQLIDFVENLTTDQFSKIQKFFDTMPKLNKKSKHTCISCGKEFQFYVENFYDFFE